MKLLIVIASFVFAQAAKLKDDTTIINIRGTCYEKEVLAELQTPNQLRVDYSTNTLYFSYRDTENSKTVASKYDLNTNTRTDIEGLNGYAQAINPKTNEVFLGGENGLYQYDKATNEVAFLGERRQSIWDMWFYKNVLYYTVFGPSRLYYFTMTNAKGTLVNEFKDISVHHFIIDNDDNVFYYNNTGVFSQKKGTNDVVLYQKLPREVVRQFTTDTNGNVYVVLGDGVYAVNKETKTLENLFRRPYSFGFAFDKDNNIIYSDYYKLFRLKQKNTAC